MIVDLSDVPPELRAPALAALEAMSIDDGHLAVQLVEPEAMRRLNAAHRGLDRPTDVLSFPIDAGAEVSGPRELGDVVICPEHAGDLREVTVHGVLHLGGMDHETDDGEMLALQDRVMAALERPGGAE